MYFQNDQKTLKGRLAYIAQCIMDAQLENLQRLSRLARDNEHSNPREARLAASQIVRMSIPRLDQRIAHFPYDPALTPAREETDQNRPRVQAAPPASDRRSAPEPAAPAPAASSPNPSPPSRAPTPDQKCAPIAATPPTSPPHRPPVTRPLHAKPAASDTRCSSANSPLSSTLAPDPLPSGP